MDDTEYAALKTYLRRLGWALSSLPERDRDDIVEETRAHILARVEQGQPLGETLSAFGSAEAYAGRFVEEMDVTRALGSGRAMQGLGVVLRRAHKSLTAAAAFFAVLIVGGWGVGGLVGAAWKPFDPQRVGLWARRTAISSSAARTCRCNPACTSFSETGSIRRRRSTQWSAGSCAG